MTDAATPFLPLFFFSSVSLLQLKTTLAKFRLDIEYDYDFFLVGISCHEKPYRLCWAINKTLELEMTASDPHVISLKKNEAPIEFPLFELVNNENETSFLLIANKLDSNVLIPEQSQADYFFIVKGPFRETDLEEMMKKIREISFVIMTYRINADQLKSKQNLLF